MVKKSFLIITLTVLLAACSGVDPITWNKNIIDQYNQSVDQIESFEDMISTDKIGDVNATNDIIKKGTNILEELDKSITFISTEKIPEGAELYQKATLEVLESMKHQIKVGLKFGNITDEQADDKIENFADLYDDASKETNEKVNIFLELQREFIKNREKQ